MKKLFCILLLALLFLSLCGCALLKDMVQVVFELATPTPTLAPTPEPTAVVTPSPSPSPSPTPYIERSKTSGTALTGEEIYRPVLISIENHPDARPQCGLMQADIVYEFLVEANYTRFLALFSDQYPCLAGPVRSARYYFLDLVQEWDAMFGFQGYATLSGDFRRSLKDYPMAVKGHTKEFQRVDFGAGKVHSLYVDVKNLVENNYGEHAPAAVQRFLFSENAVYPAAERVDRIELPFTKLAVIRWVFDEERGKLVRYQEDQLFEARVPDASAEREQWAVVPVTADNLIVQFTEHRTLTAEEQSPAGDKKRRKIDLVGSGDCVFIIDGQYLEGSWERASLADPTVYRLHDGSPVTLACGNTFIEILPKNAAWTVRFQGEAEDPTGTETPLPAAEEEAFEEDPADADADEGYNGEE